MKAFVLSVSFVSGLWIHSSQAIAAAPVVAVAGSTAGNPQQPQLAIDADGVVHLAFGVGDSVQYVRSTDGGKSFSKPVTLATVRVLSLGMRRGPRIATLGKSVFISVVGGKQGKGQDGDVLLFRSTDKGRSWNEPIIVNDHADSAREGLHAMAAGPKGRLTCVWLDLRNKRTEVFSSTSTDDGESWSKNALVYRSPNGSVCECCHPSVVYAPDGALHVMWRNSLQVSATCTTPCQTTEGARIGRHKDSEMVPGRSIIAPWTEEVLRCSRTVALPRCGGETKQFSSSEEVILKRWNWVQVSSLGSPPQDKGRWSSGCRNGREPCLCKRGGHPSRLNWRKWQAIPSLPAAGRRVT